MLDVIDLERDENLVDRRLDVIDLERVKRELVDRRLDFIV
jgi:hypothetical protein